MAVAVLVAMLAAQVLAFMAKSSPTSDEYVHHVPSGYSYLLTRDFRMNPASPPLPRMLAAIPLAILGAKAPLDHPSWQSGNSPEFAKQFWGPYNPGRMDELMFWARFPILLLSIAFAFSLYIFTRRWLGFGAALGALCLYCFSPDVVTHSGLATADLPVALFMFLSLWSFHDWMRDPKGGARTGFFTGLALLSKYTALSLPVLFVLICAAGRLRPKRLGSVLGFALVCFFTVWAGYFFELKPLLDRTPDPAKKEAVYRQVGGENLARFARQAPVPLSTFASSVASMGVTRAKGTHAFLMGHWSDEGWWYYYFVAFAVKNTVPFLILLALALWFSATKRWRTRPQTIDGALRTDPPMFCGGLPRMGLDRLKIAVLVVPVAFFFLVTLRDRAQAGIRYFLPIYPLLFAIAGAAAAKLWNKRWAPVALALLGWHAVSALSSWGHPLSYFSELAGGSRNGHKWLRDSNLDWGQDLKGLGQAVREAGYDEVILFFYGPADPGYYRIPYRPITEPELTEPRQAVYAIGAHNMDAVKWTASAKPVRTIGNSIFVYDFRKKNA